MTITELIRNFYSWPENTVILKDGKYVLKSGYFHRCVSLAILWFEENMPNHPLKQHFYKLLKTARPNNIVGFYSLIGVLQAIQQILDPEEAKKHAEEYKRRKKQIFEQLQQQEQQDEEQQQHPDDALIDKIEQTIQEIDGMVQEEGGNEDGKVVE